ncbi:hypothetical protein [Endozoicomonas sp. ALE010]|uniref:hypothetical protein n=1 Tax=Endozoicomonas sp. ALE010 TaxID=3403081 RepID=UPI003BB7BC1D
MVSLWLQRPFSQTVKTEGVVELISSAGKLQIRNREGELIKVRFSKKMYQSVRPFRMGDTVTLLANEKTVFNSATQKENGKKQFCSFLLIYKGLDQTNTRTPDIETIGRVRIMDY